MPVSAVKPRMSEKTTVTSHRTPDTAARGGPILESRTTSGGTYVENSRQARRLCRDSNRYCQTVPAAATSKTASTGHTTFQRVPSAENLHAAKADDQSTSARAAIRAGTRRSKANIAA